MMTNRMGWIIGVSVLFVLALAWLDGGAEDLRVIEQPAALPEPAR